jgi:hypothetical protein
LFQKRVIERYRRGPTRNDENLEKKIYRGEFVWGLCFLFACRMAQISDQRELGAQPVARAMIYVTDLELDAQNIQSEPSLLPEPGTILPRPGILSRLTGRSENPADRARELVNRSKRRHSTDRSHRASYATPGADRLSV